MQKVIGFFLIFVGCAGLGLWYGDRYKEQVYNLRYLCHILELFEGEIRYGKCLLTECCLRLSEKLEEPYKRTFLRIYQKSNENTGESYALICRECMETELKDLVINQEDRELFIRCFAENGYEEDILQLRIIEQTKKRMSDRLETVEKDNISKYKVAMGMGVMSGLLLIILLI